jgi:hypothetical protein
VPVNSFGSSYGVMDLTGLTGLTVMITAVILRLRYWEEEAFTQDAVSQPVFRDSV